MSTLSRYAVPCNTEGIVVLSDYRTDIPTTCPNNNTHNIDESGIFIYHTMNSKTVTINQDGDVETGGYYRADQFDFTIPAGTGATATYDISYPYNVCVYSVIFLPSQENIGDTYSITSAPDTLAGLTSKSMDIGSTSIFLPSVSMLNPGFNISITDDINTNNLGFITSIDKVNNIINCSSPSVNSFDEGSKIFISIPRFQNGKFLNSLNLNLGFSKIGSAGLPANKIVRVNYANNSGEAKTLNFIIELQF